MMVIRTFLFTDLESSTRLWEEYPELMQRAMARHDSLLRLAVEKNAGSIVKTTGDGLHAVFKSPGQAAQAALDGQRALLNENWAEETGPLRVRMGLHTGESQERDGDYYGPTLNRAARIMSAGHGGQVLVSAVTANLMADSMPEGAFLAELGEHSLRDLLRPMQLFQLSYPEMAADFPPLSTLSVFRHNLPLQLTNFVGREREKARVKQLMKETRLLTLLGPGGTGKTRLMLQVAADLLENFKDGVWLVELAPLSDPELIADQAASVFGLTQQSDVPLIETIAAHLRNKSVLILLDNVEHLVAESAVFVEFLLQRCPQVKLLVTGRESLFIDGEATLQIPSLKLPAANDGPVLKQAEESEAVQLFVERAAVVRQGFELDEQNSPAIMEIVRRLDGIPLALELAAARVRAMSVEQVAERLNDRFRLLTGGRRTALPRQQTLQALIEWSWNLLSANEQSLLRRLSVFSGGWELEAAEEVAGYDGLIVYDILDQLVSKSLVIAEEHAAGSLRYRMLESVQQFAQDKLLEGGEAEAIRNRHLACYQLLVRDLQEKMRGRDMLRWQAKMFDEVENLRAARDWSLDISPQKALELFGELGFTSRFWLRFSEARRWGRQVFEISEDYIKSTENQSDHAHYANLLIYLGTAEFVLGSSRRGIELLNQGITLSRQLGLQRKLVLGISMMIIGLIFSGNLQDVISLSEEAIEIARKENYEMELAMALGSMAPMVIFGGDRETAIQNAKDSTRFALASGNPWMLAMAEHQLARIAMALGQWEEAIDHFSISTEKFRAVHDRDFEMVTISDRAHIMRSLGDIDAAEAIYMETIDYFYQGRHMPGVAHQLESFGYIAVARQEFQRAATLFGAGANLRVEIGAPMKIPHEINEFESAIQTLKSVMDQKQLDQLMKQGAGVSIEAAIDYAKKSDR